MHRSGRCPALVRAACLTVLAAGTLAATGGNAVAAPAAAPGGAPGAQAGGLSTAGLPLNNLLPANGQNPLSGLLGNPLGLLGGQNTLLG